MKLFMLLSRVPWPLEKGDKLRAYHQLRLLAAKYEVFLYCLSDQRNDEEAIEHLKTITPHVTVFKLSKPNIVWRLFRALFSDKPYQVHYFFQKRISNKVKAAIESIQPDHIYCQLIRTAEYVKHLHNFKKTLDYMDALSAGYGRRVQTSSWWQRPFVREEARRLVSYENLIYEYFDKHTIISKQDQQLIMHPHRNEIVVVPNGVDAEYFKPSYAEKKYHMVFTGNMSYPPNVECARVLALEILPLVQKGFPEAKLLIAGANPLKEILALSSPSVHVSGWMEDIRKAYSSSSVFTAPMRSGSGLQNKLLEAMSMQMPCVTTPLAANAIGATHDVQMLIAETDEQLAQLVMQLLRDGTKAASLGEEGRNLVVENFSWKSSVDKLEKQF